jgi:hypothetical protein
MTLQRVPADHPSLDKSEETGLVSSGYIFRIPNWSLFPLVADIYFIAYLVAIQKPDLLKSFLG